MSISRYILAGILLFVSCSERPRLPTEEETDDIEPTVANSVNDFSFEIGAQSLYWTTSYNLDFNANIVTVYVRVNHYVTGTGTLVLNGAGNSLIFSHDLSRNQNQQFRLTGVNVPRKIQISFNQFYGNVTILIESETT